MPKVRIKKGSKIFHDFLFGKWPQCRPPIEEEQKENETKYPDAIFNAVWKEHYWECWREGYGDPNNYGNGSIFVYHPKDSVEIVDD